jgi:hypothetical protein
VIHGILFGIITKKAQQQKKRRSLTEKAKAVTSKKNAIRRQKTPTHSKKGYAAKKAESQEQTSVPASNSPTNPKSQE